MHQHLAHGSREDNVRGSKSEAGRGSNQKEERRRSGDRRCVPEKSWPNDRRQEFTTTRYSFRHIHSNSRRVTKPTYIQSPLYRHTHKSADIRQRPPNERVYCFHTTPFAVAIIMPIASTIDSFESWTGCRQRVSTASGPLLDCIALRAYLSSDRAIQNACGFLGRNVALSMSSPQTSAIARAFDTEPSMSPDGVVVLLCGGMGVSNIRAWLPTVVI